MMKRKLLAAAFAALAASAASAATITDSFSFPEETTEISKTGMLALFDSSLGVLNSVSLTLFGSATTDITLSNTAAQSQTARATGTVDLVFSTSLAGLDLSSFLVSLSMPTGIATIAPGTAATFPDLTASDSAVLSPAAALFSTAGGGTFTITCDSLSGIGIVGGGGNIQSVQDTTAGCGATISYDYTARTTQVPEPATLALLGLAAFGASRVSRRKA
jgi:hypothetical protein